MPENKKNPLSGVFKGTDPVKAEPKKEDKSHTQTEPKAEDKPKSEPAAEKPPEDEIPQDVSFDPVVTESSMGMVTSIPIDLIDDFENHPYAVRDDDDMKELVNSIKQVGVLEPVVVIPNAKKPGRFEMVSGHRRKHAAKLAGKTKILAVVRNMDRDDAIINMVDSNLKRSNVSPMEKARAYTMRSDALRRKVGRRSKEEQAAIEASGKKPLTADEEIAKESGESKATVQRLKSLTKLEPKLQDMDSLGEGYSEEELRSRIAAYREGSPPQNASPPAQAVHAGRKYRIVRGGARRRLTGFQKLCFKYLCLLGGAWRRRAMPMSARQGLAKMERYKRQFRYLRENRIETAEQLAMQYDAIQASIDALVDSRRDLYPQKRSGDEWAADEIERINERLRSLRRQLRMCARIEQDMEVMRDRVSAVQREERAEGMTKERSKSHTEVSL